MFRFVIEHESEIDAPAEVVFRALTDIADWPAWSTLLVGKPPPRLAVGERVELGLRTEDANYDFKAIVTAFEPGRTFEWLARTGVPGLFDGRHRFELVPLGPGRSRLRNAETYTGLFVPIVSRTAQMKHAPAGFRAMNEQLAARALALHAGDA